MDLRPYQKECLSIILNLNKGERVIVAIATGCHAKGTNILMYDGVYKKVEDIVIGDIVMGDDSNSRKVLELHNGIDDMYKITPNKGVHFIVNKNHILSLKKTNERNNKISKAHNIESKNEIINISVCDYLKTSKRFKHIYKIHRTGVDFNLYSKSIMLDPYLLGLILGDGCICNGALNICTPDIEIENEIYKYADMYNLKIRKESQNNNKSYIYHFICMINSDGKKNKNYIREQLKNMKLIGTKSGNKFIPHIYKISSREVRLQLLAGLLDTNGYLYNKCFEYCTKSPFLRDDVSFIARSLGFFVSSNIKLVKNVKYYRLNISGNCELIPTKIIRKQSPIRKMKKNVLNTGFKIEYIGVGEYFGFTVDKNNLYLFEDFMITHNSGKTVVFSKFCNQAKGRKLIIVPSTELREQAIEKLLNINPNLQIGSVQAGLDEINTEIVVATRQSLTHFKSTRIKRMIEYGDFDYIIYDECHQSILQLQKILSQFHNNPTVIGFTATPYNPMQSLIFQKIAYKKTLLSLIAEGYLTMPKAIEIQTQLDLSKVSVSHGDFNQIELERVVNTQQRNNLIVQAYQKFALERKSTIIFAVNINHAVAITEEFNNNKIICKCIYSNMDDREEGSRIDIINEFKNGDLSVIVNIGILTTGFDSSRVDCIIMACPTKSKIKFQQCLGRGLRLYPNKKDCLIIDICDVIRNNELMNISNIFGFKVKSGTTIKDSYQEFKQQKQEEQLKQKELYVLKQQELSLIAKEIKLFNNHLLKAFKESYFDWFKIDNITFALSVCADLHWIIEKIEENEFVVYKVSTKKESKYVEFIEISYDLQESIEKVENFYIIQPTSFMNRNVGWKKEKSTDMQRRYFYYCKTKWDVYKFLNKSKIAAAIKKFKNY